MLSGMKGKRGTLFRIIPAIDLKDGKVVRLRQGKEDEITVKLDNPIEIAEMWVAKGVKALHIIDLDGAFKGKLMHEDLIKEIRRRVDVEIQVGGGIRDIATAEGLLSFGIDRVILGTIAVSKVEEVKKLAKKYPGRVMIAVDAKKDKVVIKGWKVSTKYTPLEIAKIYEDCEVSLLYTNVDIEGLISGVVIEKIKRLVENTSLPVYVAGGIATKEDVIKIKEVGAIGVVIGSALYLNKLKLEDLLELEND